MKRQKSKYKLKPGVTREVVAGKSDLSDSAEGAVHNEYFGKSGTGEDLNASDDDAGANEGVGDGKMGRTKRNADE